MDVVLFKQLKKGFADHPKFTWEPNKPNVLFTDLCGEEWDDVEIIDNYWVVVIDYHD